MRGPWAIDNDPRMVDNGRNDREEVSARGTEQLVGRPVEEPIPGAGRGALVELLEAGCPKCGGALRAETAFSGLVELVLLRFAPLTDSEREQLERTVELRCPDCGYAGAAQRPARKEK